MKIQSMRATLAVGLLLAIAGSAQAQLPYATTIAKRGDPATGLSPNTIVFQLFGATYVNSGGVFGVRSDLSGTGTTSTSNLGLWSGRTLQTLTNNAREGNEVATLSGTGVRYSAFDVHHLANDGGISFITTLTGSGITSANNQAIIVGQPGSFAIAASKGSGTVPGVGGTAVFNGFSGLVHGDGGLIGFQSSLTGAGIPTTADLGLWGGTPGNIQLIAREGSPVPGAPANVNYSNFNDPATSASSLLMSPSGIVCFYTALTGTGTSASNNIAIMHGPIASPTIAIRLGDPAPNRAAGSTISAMTSAPDLGANGHIVFNATTTTPSRNVIYSGLPGSLQVVAENTIAAPGAGTGVTYSTFTASSLRINSSGAVTFQATLAGTGVVTANNTGIFTNHGGTMRLAYRKGDPLPGVPATASISAFNQFAFNDAGQIAMFVTLTGTGITTANNEAVFLWDPVAGIKLAAYEGATTHIGNGQTVAISSAGFNNSVSGTANFSFDSTGNGRGSALSDNGTIVLGMEFVDGTQRVVALRPTTNYCSRADVAQLGGLALPDGQLSADDLVRYLAAFFASEAAIADLATVGGNPTPDGAITADDLISFLGAFFAGCV